MESCSGCGVILLFGRIIAKAVYEHLKTSPANWRNIIKPFAEKIVIDSSRYEEERWSVFST